MKKLLVSCFIVAITILIGTLFGSVKSAYSQTFSNGQFENWTGNQPDDWTLDDLGGRVTYSRGENQGITGDALKVVAENNGGNVDGILECIVTDITGGTNYNIDISIKGNDSKMKIIFWKCQWLDALNNQVGKSFSSGYETSTTSWTKCEVSETAPTNAVKIRIELQIYIISGYTSGITYILLDNLSFNDVPLPVELLSFTSSVADNSVNLNWSTAVEFNNYGFDIERKSTDWKKIGFVKGHGTINTPQYYSFPDRFLSTGKYNYRLKQMDFNGNHHYYYLSSEVSIGIPNKFRINQNYPNPFNPTTTINYQLPKDMKVSIKVFDILGKEVKTLINGHETAGYHTADFDGSTLSSGIYFYLIKTEEYEAIKRMVLIK